MSNLKKVIGVSTRNKGEIWVRVKDTWYCKSRNFTLTTSQIMLDIKNGYLKLVNGK